MTAAVTASRTMVTTLPGPPRIRAEAGLIVPTLREWLGSRPKRAQILPRLAPTLKYERYHRVLRRHDAPVPGHDARTRGGQGDAAA